MLVFTFNPQQQSRPTSLDLISPNPSRELYKLRVSFWKRYLYRDIRRTASDVSFIEIAILGVPSLDLRSQSAAVREHARNHRTHCSIEALGIETEKVDWITTATVELSGPQEELDLFPYPLPPLLSPVVEFDDKVVWVTESINHVLIQLLGADEILFQQKEAKAVMLG
jgi:hypothetical protein